MQKSKKVKLSAKAIALMKGEVDLGENLTCNIENSSTLSNREHES